MIPPKPCGFGAFFCENICRWYAEGGKRTRNKMRIG